MSRIDLRVQDHRLATDASLETAIRISLLTDRRVRPDDGVRGDDLKGWAGDQYLRRPLGSRLWSLKGMKIDRALDLVEDIVLEALRWMVEDGLAVSVKVPLIQRTGPDSIRFETVVTRESGSLRLPFEVSI